jgi:hypothetical protein
VAAALKILQSEALATAKEVPTLAARLNRLRKRVDFLLNVPPAKAGSGRECKGLDAGLKASSTD